MKKTTNYIFLIILFLSLINCSETIKSHYICPPCNNSCDAIKFNKGGKCPVCQMTLINPMDDILLVQNDGKEKHKKIETLLAEYEKDNSPGMAVGIIHNGETLFSKGYGSANLDYNTPNTVISKFYIGSMAKQFVGAALVKLEYEGKIKYSNTVQTYLPDFPEYKYPITLDHIIHHTSGIRGTNSMQLFAGVDQNFEEHFTAKQQYEMIKNQKELNFKPGTEYRYSSGGYIVLAEVIEKVSGLSLRDYLDENFFKPLEMKNTFVIDNHNEVVKNRVISYVFNNEKYERRSMIFDGKGDGSILTTVEDLAKWDRAFFNDDLLGIPNFSKKMYQKGKLASGKEIDYGMALENYNHNGLKYIAHNGGMLGFRADLVRFPEQKFSVIVLANDANIHSTGIALQIADMYLKDLYNTTKRDVLKPKKYVSLNPDVLKQKTGKYFSNDINQWRRISFTNDTLYYDSGNLDYASPIYPINENTFYLEALNRTLYFNNNEMIMNYETHKHSLTRFDDTLPKNILDLEKFIGMYYSEELNTFYEFYQENNNLLLKINNESPQIIFPKPTDPRINWNSKDKVWIGFGFVRFKVDKNNSASGFYIGDNRVKSIWFNKIR